MLSTYLRPEWPRAVLLGVLLCAGIGLQLANPQIAKAFIDHAQAGEPLERLIWIAALFIGVALLTQVATVAEASVATDLGWRTTNALRADLTRHVLELDATFHAEHGAGELIERIDGDVSAIAEYFASFVVQVVGNALFLVGVLVLLFMEDWRIGMLLTVCVLAALGFMFRGGGFVAIRSRTARATAGDLSAFLEERLDGLVDLKSSGADDFVTRRLDARLATRFQAVRASVLAGSMFNSVVGMLFVVGAGGSLALSAGLYGAGLITLGGVYAVFRYATMLRQPLERLTRQMNTFLTATGALMRVRAILDTASAVRDGKSNLPDGALSVELDHVSFAYGAEPVLHEIECRVEPGEVLGLVGRTGVGKTTIARLLFRLHDPSAGVVRIGGRDLRDVRLEILRARIGLVTQDVQLFEGTLRDNVALFDRSVPDQRLYDAFAQLGLEGWLRMLPSGLDTRLGGGGRGLSAGEAQLVALARVFLKDPGLVILDEASSRLDPDTQRLVECALSRLMEGRTGIIIAHRPESFRRFELHSQLQLHADRVMVVA